MDIQITNAGPIVTESKFSGYDFGMNPYVGCQFGCSYCYVRFFVKDEGHEWSDFVRVRKHLERRLPRDLARIPGGRLVIGTMTDPYQPIERRERLTRRSLELILQNGNLQKVGVFTRSPIALDDLELITRLPQSRIHITVGPFSRDVMRRLEPIAVSTEARLRMAGKFKRAGVCTWVNVSAGLPGISEQEIPRIVEQLIEFGVDGFYVDCIQPYAGSLEKTMGGLSGMDGWGGIRGILTDHKRYKEWQKSYRAEWERVWRAQGNTSIRGLWSVHQDRNRYDLRTGEAVSRDVE